MSRSYIIKHGRMIDGRGSVDRVTERWAQLRTQGLKLTELTIDPLHAGWDTRVEPNHFRSGCGPIEAIAHADKLVRSGQADAVRISGHDDLRTRYANDKALRQQLMMIYDGCSIPEAYTLLAHAFMARHGISEVKFKQLASALYDNYKRTAERDGQYTPPRAEAFEMATELFRGVDCANPVVDFAGAVIVGSEPLARDEHSRVAILGTGVAQTHDGPAHVEEIARYEHLAAAWQAACTQAGVDMARAFTEHRALLEAYTCFPVVPLGFLLASGIAKDVTAIEQLLTTHDVTVTGGMNIARAAWNNPALNGVIAMCEKLVANASDVRSAVAASGEASSKPKLGVVHGNGGLGYRQGVAIFGAQ